ncbi:MAG TPA: tetratricopeptide repeat protein, partial [bacterium]|nr:tetratricopeptide repeat protein [bacterium]
FRGGKIPEALRALNGCVPAEVPLQIQKLQLQADILCNLSRWNEAATILDRALAINPNPRTEDYIGRADLSLNAGLPQEAMAVLNQGIERLNNSVELRWRAVGVAIRAQLTDAALVQLDQLEKMMPGSALVHARRGDVLAACGRNAEANAAWNEALSRIESTPAKERSDADQSLAKRLRRNLNLEPEAGGPSDRD